MGQQANKELAFAASCSRLSQARKTSSQDFGWTGYRSTGWDYGRMANLGEADRGLVNRTAGLDPLNPDHEDELAGIAAELECIDAEVARVSVEEVNVRLRHVLAAAGYDRSGFDERWRRLDEMPGRSARCTG